MKHFVIKEKLANPPWKDNKFLFHVMSVLGGKNYTKIVGGALRDFYLGIKPKDYDLATTHLPNEVLIILKRSNIKCFSIGIEFGTISAVLDKNTIHITTLRKDIKTDGRHAVVEYTKNWFEDSLRRDFTFNAMYADFDGTIYDPLNGLKDLKNKNINFIGNPASRIAEDRLRILRYFRFFGFFPYAYKKDNNLEEVIKSKGEIKHLSGERIYNEFSKILGSLNAVFILRIMLKYDILSIVIPELKGINISSIKLLSYIPEKLVICRLGFLLRKSKGESKSTSKHLLLSKPEQIELNNVVNFSTIISDKMDIRKRIFEVGNINAKNEYFISLAESRKKPKKEILSIIDNWVAPVFPLKGSDVNKLGIKEGPVIGALLKKVENWWVYNNFISDKEVCLEKLKQYIKEIN